MTYTLPATAQIRRRPRRMGHDYDQENDGLIRGPKNLVEQGIESFGPALEKLWNGENTGCLIVDVIIGDYEL